MIVVTVTGGVGEGGVKAFVGSEVGEGEGGVAVGVGMAGCRFMRLIRSLTFSRGESAAPPSGVAAAVGDCDRGLCGRLIFS